MTRRPCLVCRRVFMVTKVCESRCEGCQRTYDQARYAARDAHRPSPRERGYDSRHRALREERRQRIEAGEPCFCWRCGLPITKDMTWALGHVRDDRNGVRHPEHVNPCNSRTLEPGRITEAKWRAAKARRANPR
jgi:hypothetical protein